MRENEAVAAKSFSDESTVLRSRISSLNKLSREIRDDLNRSRDFAKTVIPSMECYQIFDDKQELKAPVIEERRKVSDELDELIKQFENLSILSHSLSNHLSNM